MVNSIWIRLLGIALLAGVYLPSLRPLLAQEPDKPLRELFVPFEELDVLLGNDARRVYMTRAEYEELLVNARVVPNTVPPAKLALLVANYQAEVGEGRATIRGELQLEVLDAGIQVLVLPFSGVGVRAAKLDDAPASLAKNDQGQTWLFVEGIGKHRLSLDLVMPLQSMRHSKPCSSKSPQGLRVNFILPFRATLKSSPVLPWLAVKSTRPQAQPSLRSCPPLRPCQWSCR